MTEKGSDIVIGISRTIERRMLTLGYPASMLKDVVVELPARVWDENLGEYADKPLAIIRGVLFRRKSA